MIKKTIVATAIALCLPFVAFAAEDCNLIPVERCQGGGNPALISMPWGLTGGETPTFPSGGSITDLWGKVFLCPWWFPAGCYDITRTAWYAVNR